MDLRMTLFPSKALGTLPQSLAQDVIYTEFYLPVSDSLMHVGSCALLDFLLFCLVSV